jgi:CheY-like chemotaxis protein
MTAQGKRILLIDDDPDMHDAIKMILEPLGCQVKCCLTGPDGLETLRADPPDLLLLDIMLSSPSEGFHVSYEMKQDDALKDIPIIMISAIGQTMGMDYAKELGTDYVKADMFMEKPLEANKLREAVEQVLRDKAGHQREVGA